ncbi:unnamed protein product [Gongylonema pulchrum]|uniref:RNA helicase n=1 Tax=Gongylonema pulchrum TaxID=637853 RepID=A0A183DBR6_9BILA|nr:unnamed protein product [Gongylonema pulchrum]
MAKGSLESMGYMDDRTQPLEQHINVMSSTFGLVPAPLLPQMFANAGREHMQKYGGSQIGFVTSVKLKPKSNCLRIRSPGEGKTPRKCLIVGKHQK